MAKKSVRKKRLTPWEKVKQGGSAHYKSGRTEPIDLYKDAGALHAFALCSIIKYAYRNIEKAAVYPRDMDKIIHYAEMLKAAEHEASK